MPKPSHILPSYTLHFDGLPARTEGSPLYWHIRNELASLFPHKKSIYLPPKTGPATVKYNTIDHLRKDLAHVKGFPYDMEVKWKGIPYSVSVDCHPRPPLVESVAARGNLGSFFDPNTALRILQQKNLELTEQLKSATSQLQKLKNVLSSRSIIETFAKRLRKEHLARDGVRDGRGVRYVLNCHCRSCKRIFAELCAILNGGHCAAKTSPRRLRLILTQAYSDYSEIIHQAEVDGPELGEINDSEVEVALSAVARYADGPHGPH